MILNFPRDIPWLQLNKGDTTGSIWSSRNIDLIKNEGSVRVTEKNIVTTGSDNSDQTFVNAAGAVVTFGATETGQLLTHWVAPEDSSTPPTLQQSWVGTQIDASSITLSVTIPSGTNQQLVVLFHYGNTNSNTSVLIDSITFDGVAMTNETTRGSGNVTVVQTSSAYKASPSTGTFDIVGTITGGPTEVLAIEAFLFENAKQTGSPIDTNDQVDSITTAVSSLDIDDDVDFSASGKDNFLLLASSFTTLGTHTYTGIGVVDVNEENIDSNMTISSALLGEYRDTNPQDLVTAFCKERGTVGGSNDMRWWAMSNTNVYQTSATNEGFETDTSATTPTFTDNQDTGDIKAFDGKVYLAENGNLYRRTSADWTTISTGLPNGKQILEVYADRLYIASDTEVDSMNTSEVLAGSGTNYLDLAGAQLENLTISCMRATSTGLWIGTVNSQGGRAKMIFWNGETGNTPEIIKTLESGMALAITVKDDIPYVLDNRGVLMAFNGSYFEEVARFDFDDIHLYQFDTPESSNRWIHHNGMQTINDEILMAVNTRPEDTNDEFPVRHPSGVYAYNAKHGIYLKHTFTAHKDESTYTDLGMLEIDQVGAIFPLFDDEENNLRTEQSDFLVSYSYKSDNSTTVYAIAKSDKRGYDRADTIKAGVLITPFLQANQVQEQWKKIYTFIKPFVNSTDKIVVKYRKQKYDTVTSDITWVNTTSFTTTDSNWATIKTDFEADKDFEVEGISGDGAGYCSHITNITEAGGTYTVTIDETIANATTNTARVRVTQWEKVNVEFTDEDEVEQFKEFNVDATSSKIQFKLYMVGTDVELERLAIYSSPSQQY